MLTVSIKSSIDDSAREDVDRLARHLVLDTYRAVRQTDAAAQAGFDAAVQAYQRQFPHVPGALAKQAVACIISGAD